MEQRNEDRFLVDLMLIRLGRWLRLVGKDVANAGEADDRMLVQKSRLENRTLITRDRNLAELCRVAGVDCILINSNGLQGQMKEMARIGIELQLNPQRCTMCNGTLREAVKCIDNENGHLQKIKKTWECEDCGKLYWAGSHWKKMEEILEKIALENANVC